MKKLRKTFSRYSFAKKALIFALPFAVVGAALLIFSYASPSPYDDIRQASLVDSPKLGLVYKGLRAVKKDADHPCKGIFEIEGAKANGQPICTHGPDPAPVGVDVTKITPEIKGKQLDKRPKDKTTTQQLQGLTDSQITAAAISFTNQIPYKEAPVPCTSGRHRIKLVMITHGSDKPHYRELERETAYRMESELEYSAIRSGPGAVNKHYRFVTNSSCEPTVALVIGPSNLDLSVAGNVTTYLANHGYNDPYTKYLVWDYSEDAKFCGIATIWGDSNPSAADNKVNNRTGWAVIGPACWSYSEVHEIMHNLGAVNLDAPRTSGSYHCLDEYDIMCYADHRNSAGQYTKCINSLGVAFSCGQNGKPLYKDPNCPTTNFDWQLDCNKNDYFNTGIIPSTRYLYDHWNVANSPYLQ